ncbi:sensor histidine kinase [Aquimarina agarilytica]|uniref:sensor histidine kinase n=1 Tax=Aquimarina agarilytica TaxID=1087449 RepID=UPI00028846F6|nr:ATP-binding protein [Aquimarina agarilytica]
MNSKESLDDKTFSTLSKVYMIALGFIAFLVIVTQVFIQGALANNDFDAQIINIAGKQRMLSQKISKTILLWNSPLQITRDNNNELNNSLKEWSEAHTLLKNNLNTLPKSSRKTTLENLFFEVNLEINELLVISKKIQNSIHSDKIEANKWITAFIKKEPAFLNKMNDYVYAYEAYASEKINTIKRIEYIAFALLFLLLLAEFFLLFRPATSKIKTTISELILSKDNAVKMAEKANTAVKQKNETLEELQVLQKAINQNLFFARIDQDGTIISSGKKMQEIINREKSNLKHIIYENLGLNILQQQELKQLINSQKGTILNHEFEVSFKHTPIDWMDISIFPINKNKGIVEYLIVCLDISKRKKAQNKIDILREDKIKTESAIQKSKASLIVEAQEEERKRIAKDIHDSIGQMLTALKFNIESLDPTQNEKFIDKVDVLKEQTKNIILGVRMATFNLTPPELLDYGVITAIQKMTNQLNKFTKTEIIFENNVEDNLRFETLVETNLYRVTQESINNAIKYAEATYILVSMKKTDQLLSISITDNGKGFDPSKMPKTPKDTSEGGMGLFFMKERMEYINGRVFLNSTPSSGTRVVINYPIAE